MGTLQVPGCMLVMAGQWLMTVELAANRAWEILPESATPACNSKRGCDQGSGAALADELCSSMAADCRKSIS